MREPTARTLHRTVDGRVDLILHRAILSPTDCHRGNIGREWGLSRAGLSKPFHGSNQTCTKSKSPGSSRASVVARVGFENRSIGDLSANRCELASDEAARVDVSARNRVDRGPSVSCIEWGNGGAVSIGVDDAIRAAIKLAVDANEIERARLLIQALETSSVPGRRQR